MNAPDVRRCEVLIAVQQSLLGEVTSNLRAVTVEFGETDLRLEAFFDRDVTEDDEEAMSLVDTELMALFPDSHVVSVILTRKPSPELIPKDRIWAFHRREPLIE